MSIPGYEALAQRAAQGDVVATFHWGLVLAAHRRWAESKAALERAAATGHGDALAWLGLHALYGYGGTPDNPLALQRLAEAEALGSGEASYQLAQLAWCDGLVPRDDARMAERLVAAAHRDHAGALRALALVYARRASADSTQADASNRCLLRAAALGDRVSLYLLGLRWRASSDEAQRAQAETWIATAAALGLQRAAAQSRVTVRPTRPDPQPLGSLPTPHLRETLDPERIVHCERPLLETIDGFLGGEECEYLITLAEPLLHRSMTVHEDTGDLQTHAARTSSDAALYGAQDDFGARWLQSRMTTLLGVPFGNGEHMVVLSYEPGQEYRPHHDFLPAAARGNRPEPDQPGQRVHTLFCFLDDVAAGGATDFPRIGVAIEPRRGRLVHFTNLAPDGSGDVDTLHAGLPVTAGRKWLATMWTRERRYRNW